MHHLAIETCLFQRKVGVREFHEEDLHTYAGLCGYSHVYVGLKTNSGPGSGGKESDMGLTETIWHRFSGSIYIILIMHCWHYPRRSWFKITVFWFQGE